jgi:hypothetical protein
MDTMPPIFWFWGLCFALWASAGLVEYFIRRKWDLPFWIVIALAVAGAVSLLVGLWSLQW